MQRRKRVCRHSKTYLGVREMIILFVFIIIICLYKSEINLHGLSADYLSYEKTNSLKGLCALIVIGHHISQQISGDVSSFEFENVLCLDFFNIIGFLAVAVFFFISGYGLQYSLKNKKDYLQNFIRNKFLNVLLPYLVIVLIYSLFYVFIESWTIEDIIHSYATGLPVAKNSWYIIAIIYFYFTYWLSHRLIKNNLPATLMFIATVVLYIFICRQIGFGKWWTKSVLCMPIGIIWYEAGNKIFDCLKRRPIIYYVCLIAFSALTVFFFNSDLKIITNDTDYNKWLIDTIDSVVFIVAFVLISMKISFKNKILDFLGKISFELYMIHGLYIAIFSKIDFISERRILFLLIVLLCSIPSAYLLNIAFKTVFYKKKITQKQQ